MTIHAQTESVNETSLTDVKEITSSDAASMNCSLDTDTNTMDSIEESTVNDTLRMGKSQLIEL